jgi:hypothetical protein
MKALFILLFCLLALRICVAQECRLTDLSRKYIYLITADKSKNEYGGSQISKLSVEIIRKADKKSVQKFFIKPGIMLDSFSDCSAVTSYVTGKHAKEEGADNDWEDFIVAGLNFDGREDFAVKEDFMNTGAIYDYFTKTKSGRFAKDSFLSGSYFPYKIDPKTKTLSTGTAATTGGYTETVFKYNPTTKKWRVLKSVHRKVG